MHFSFGWNALRGEVIDRGAGVTDDGSVEVGIKKIMKLRGRSLQRSVHVMCDMTRAKYLR